MMHLPTRPWPELRAGWNRLATRPAALVAALALLPALGAAAALVPAASAHSHPRHVLVAPPVVLEPSPPAPSPSFDAAVFAAARKRPAATAPLPRLPQVDLAGIRVSGIPTAALRAYVTAEHDLARTDSGCRVHWWLLAGIGYVESGHAASGGSAKPRWNGIARPPIYGPALDGHHGFAAIADTDHGRLDHDKKWDRAVGPMQFLPSTWAGWGTDTHGRTLDPQDIRAAALAAARYLCAGGLDLSRQEGLAGAVYSYNHSFDYVRLVLSVAARYAGVSAASLGVDRLPHDKPAHKPAKKASPTPSTSPAAAPAGSAAASPSASPRSTASPSASASLATGEPAPGTDIATVAAASRAALSRSRRAPRRRQPVTRHRSVNPDI